jgi:DNA-binding NtrC family response regulator
MARVLVADDDHLLRWSLERALARDGHDIHLAESGKVAADVVEGEQYQVAIINYWASEPTGRQLLRQIKAKTPQTHVIFLAAEITPHQERQARRLGAFDFLEKPFPLASLKQAVNRALLTPERRRGSRGCCAGCEWQRPCGGSK